MLLVSSSSGCGMYQLVQLCSAECDTLGVDLHCGKACAAACLINFVANVMSDHYEGTINSQNILRGKPSINLSQLQMTTCEHVRAAVAHTPNCVQNTLWPLASESPRACRRVYADKCNSFASASAAILVQDTFYSFTMHALATPLQGKVSQPTCALLAEQAHPHAAQQPCHHSHSVATPQHLCWQAQDVVGQVCSYS